MILITKNITVTDDTGRVLAPTYPKRAKGLVKHGRARYIGENSICLACPPDVILESEDMKMSNLPDKKQAIETTAAPETTVTGTAGPPITARDILDRIDKIIADNGHVREALETIRTMEVNEGMNNVDGDKARGEAVAAAVTGREETNKQTLRLLEKMYDDMMGKPSEQLPDDVAKFNAIAESINLLSVPEDFAQNIIRTMAQQMFVKAGAEIVR